MKSWIVASGSSPTSIAYDRTNARLKIPPGRREMSLRSRASRTPTEIFVALAIWRSVTPRRSRASRSLPPKSVAGRSPGTNGTALMLGSRSDRVKPRAHAVDDIRHRRRRREESNGRDARRAGRGHIPRAVHRHPPDRQDGRGRRANDVGQTGGSEKRRAVVLRSGTEDGAGDEVIDRTGGARFVRARDGPADEEPRRRDRANRSRGDRVGAQMHAVRAAGERDVQAIVDDNPRARRRRVHGRDDGAYERGDRRAEIGRASCRERV